MSGFKNDVVFAKNADFSQSNNLSPSESNGLVTNAELWIGDTTLNAGGTHINKGTLVSPNNSITFGYTSPNITAVVNTAVVGDLHITPYIVSAAGLVNGANYTNIQAAVSAAATAGGGIVYVQPGTYIENVTMLPGVNLVGLVGSSGNIGYTISGGEDLPVTIQGNFILDLTSAVATPTVELNNITFTANAGVVFSMVGNIALLESGFITFTNSQLVAGTAPTFIFSVNGFFNVNLNSSEVTETTPGTTNFVTWGATPFLNLNIRDSYININTITALTVPTGSFNVFTLQDTYWSARLDVSAGSQTLSFEAVRCVLAGTGAAAGDPLINFGANDAGLSATNCLINTTSGSLANSTSATAAAIFRYNNCIWNNPLTLGANARGEFSYCEFYGGTSAAITFSSAQDIKLLHCIVNSTNNPAIAGAGAGIITYSDLVFVGNGTFAGTLTLATTNWRPYSVALAATDGTKVGTCNFNSAQFSVDANGFVSIIGGGFTWNDISGAFSPLKENGYFITGTATGTLPASPAQGDTIKFFVDHASQLLTIKAAGTQLIRLGSLVSSAGGTAISTLQGDSVELVYRAANTTWEAVCGFSGTWTMA